MYNIFLSLSNRFLFLLYLYELTSVYGHRKDLFVLKYVKARELVPPSDAQLAISSESLLRDCVLCVVFTCFLKGYSARCVHESIAHVVSTSL